MDTYNKQEAADLLGVSRQTIFRHCKKHPDRYTMTTDAGEQVITLRGLEELRAVLHGTTKRYKALDTDTQPDVTDKASTLRQELERERERNKATLEDVARLDMSVTSLQTQLEKANERIAALEAEKSVLYDLLRDAQRKIPNAQPAKKKPIIPRLMAWLNLPKEQPPEQPQE